jgi:prepilin-type N-terminal cleavage/methylation domain-containing protein
MKNSSGFTLIEMMVTLFIFVLALIMLTSLIVKGMDTYTQGQTLTQLQDETRKVMNDISSEIREADSITTASGSTLEFTKLDPFTYCSGTSLLQQPSNGPGNLETVKYTLNGDQIVREICGSSAYDTRISPSQIKVNSLQFSSSSPFPSLPPIITITIETEQNAQGERRPKTYTLTTEAAPRASSFQYQ